MARKTAPRTPTPEIALRGRDASWRLTRPERLRAEADYWAFAVAQRGYWAPAGRLRAYMARLARETLGDELGLSAPDFDGVRASLETTRMIEVVLPADVRAEPDGARHMPWEYLLTAATQPSDAHYPPTVIRCLDSDATPRARRRRSVLYVQSLPGELADAYGFDTEAELPQHLVPARRRRPLVNPSLGQLRTRVANLQPDVIHVAGIDNHHACALYKTRRSPDAVRDGMVLRGRGGRPSEVSARELARALCAGKKKPELIVFNLYNSSADLGAEAVRAGAEAALGFQHAVDDALAELFIAELYRMLGPRGLPLSGALIAARTRLGTRAKARTAPGSSCGPGAPDSPNGERCRTTPSTPP